MDGTATGSPILSHTALADKIAGKKILHLNSLGKDAVLCLDWLNNYARCGEIVSLLLQYDACYPTDEKYIAYLKRRYPKTKFVVHRSVTEINDRMARMLQSPLYVNYVVNNAEFESFNEKKVIEEYRVDYGMDLICSGISCYEGMGRAIYLRRTGLLDQSRKTIYPIGLMKQSQVKALLKASGEKLNPSYKASSESHDSATYFKMRYSFITNTKHKEIMYKHYPLLALDEIQIRKAVQMKTKKPKAPKVQKQKEIIPEHILAERQALRMLKDMERLQATQKLTADQKAQRTNVDLWKDTDFYFSVVFQSSAQKYKFIKEFSQKFDLQVDQVASGDEIFQIFNGLLLAKKLGIQLQVEKIGEFPYPDLELKSMALDGEEF